MGFCYHVAYGLCPRSYGFVLQSADTTCWLKPSQSSNDYPSGRGRHIKRLNVQSRPRICEYGLTKWSA